MTHRLLDSDITRGILVRGIPNAKQKQPSSLRSDPGLNQQSPASHAIETDAPGDVDPSKRWGRLWSGYLRRMTARFFDQKYDPALIAFRYLDPITGFADQIWNIDHRQRIGTVHLQKITQPQGLERLSRLQRRQRAFEPCQVEFRLGHVPNMPKGSGIVNRRHRGAASFQAKLA
jgi:hypothetical protein